MPTWFFNYVSVLLICFGPWNDLYRLLLPFDITAFCLWAIFHDALISLSTSRFLPNFSSVFYRESLKSVFCCSIFYVKWTNATQLNFGCVLPYLGVIIHYFSVVFAGRPTRNCPIFYIAFHSFALFLAF